MKLSRSQRNLVLGLAFLSPNILGFLAFTVVPLIFSLVLAFSNWNLRLHNMFKPGESIRFAGIGNFVQLLTEPNFWRFFGNTLFMMMSIPFAIAGSLIAAIMLSKDLRGGGGRVFVWLLCAAVMFASSMMLVAAGAGGTAMGLLLAGLVGGVFVAGVTGGTSVYRTLFYTPHFVTGVPTFLLWKKMYAPTEGPVNKALRPVLDGVTDGVNALPGGAVSQAGLAIGALLFVGLLVLGLGRLGRMWREGDLGWGAAVVPVGFLMLPVVLGAAWWPTLQWPIVLVAGAALVVVWQLALAATHERQFTCPPSAGFGTAIVLALGVMVAMLVVLGLAKVVYHLPAMAAADGGLQAPLWIHEYNWAKPSIMLMGLWGAIGSNNMLMYLAALTNVPQELYEAADIDGARPLQRFWNVTWPQLAPTTFFIVVMSTIGGIQGGFESARTMTQGGPAGSTTTLAYFVYQEGFETGRLGYASAVAWSLFAIVFALTMFNWKFGNKYVND